MIEQISNLINNLGLVFLAIAPTVFVFSVTLLGDAIERSQQEERAARENDKLNIQKNIAEVQESLDKAKKDGDTTELTGKLKKLMERQQKTERKIKDIKVKYNSIDFINTVVYPCVAFIFSSVIGSLGATIKSASDLLPYCLLVLSQLSLFSYGIGKIYRSLRLVQRISTNKKASEHYDRLKEVFKLALKEYHQSTKEEVFVEFVDKAFPLNVATSMDLVIPFRVKLTKGSILKNASILFFVSDGLELVDPPETSSWRQPSCYNLPNIRTVTVNLGNLSIGLYIRRTLKLKTPATAGKYLFRYAVRADGYSGPSEDLTLLVW